MMNWNVEHIRLDDQTMFETLNGLWTGKTPPFVTAGVIRNTNFTESGRIDYLDVAWLQTEQKQLAKRQLKPGDIIIERSGGGPKQPVGRVVFFSREDGPFSFSNFTSVIRVRDADAFDAKFIFYVLLELYHSGRTEDLQRRTTGIRNLDFTAYKERATFPRITLLEQRKIAGVLGLVQRAIEQQERLIALTTELKKALLHKLFTEGLHGEPQKQTEIGPVPESWEVAELGKLVNLFGGYAFRSEDSVPISNTQLVRMGNLYQNKLDLTRSPIFYPDDFTQQYARFVLKQGDLIMSLTGTSGKEDYGFTVEIKHVPKTLLLNQRVARVDITCSKLVKDFLFYFLLSRKFLNQLYQTAKGMKQANLSTYAMKQLKVPVPSVREQKNIADYFRAIDQRNDIHQRRVDMLQDLFRTLLHQLMMAQIRVRDLDLSELESDL